MAKRKRPRPGRRQPSSRKTADAQLRSRTRAAARARAAAAVSRRAPSEVTAFFDHVKAISNLRAEIRALTDAELARPRATRPDTPPQPPERIRRAASLQAMRVWREAASALLDALRAGHTGDAATAIPPERQPEAARLMRRLVVSLSKTAARTAMLEGAQRRWHVAAKAAREGIALRRDTAREILGTALRPNARLHLMLAHATFMVEGNSPRMRRELRDAVRDMPGSKGLAYWLARYEVMVGHYAAAGEIANAAADYAPIRHTIMPMLEPESAHAPWLSWPCNFYTYRYTLAQTDELHRMQEALAALANDPETVEAFESFGIPESAIEQLKDRAESGAKALSGLLLWNQANADMGRSKYASAARNYEDCQRTIVSYFASRYPDLNLSDVPPPDESGSDPSPIHQLENALETLASSLIQYNAPTRQIWTFFRERYLTLTLDELHTHDWRRPKVVPLAYEFAEPLPDHGEATDFVTALVILLTRMSILKSLQTFGEKVEEKLDAPLLAIALVFCPLGIAEANRLRRHFDKALSQCRQLLHRHQFYKVLSEVVEKPFVKILKARILLDKADAQYKARTMAAEPALNPDSSLKYQGLEAAESYQGVLVAFEDEGQYVNRVNASVASATNELQGLMQHTFHPVAGKEAGTTFPPPLTTADRRAFALVGKKLHLETVVPRQGEYPEADRRVRPHESLVIFAAPGGDSAPPLLETNPVVYALIVEARARLLQMESGLNYLGYSDAYTPPWRFQFLLDRARYLAEHAKNAQREYLNFLSNAEREEFQELTAAQAVEMEKSNIRIETARVEQVRREVEAAQQSSELSALNAIHAQARLDRYAEFDEYADSLFGTNGPDPLELLSDIANIVPGLNPVLSAVGDFFTGGAISGRKQALLADAQRSVEKFNLGLAIAEADKAAEVARSQVAVAQGGLLVAGMQRAAAVLRHEFALQNLAFLRNRTLNAELWYRLAAAIRGVADTYLRYTIEMAFLAEQAYEFEADKRIDVIRFDYDVSELGDMLAGDFVLRDLDTLEQDLIVVQKTRQQHVRYVLSMAREFPEALQELRERGAMTFSVRLEQLERRFPGLFNLRIGSVEALPVALMDAARFSFELTHLGAGQVRLSAQPGEPAETLGTDWLTGLEAVWSIKHRTTVPETNVFSGLTRQDVTGLASFFAANQRGAFEGLAAASAWRADFSATENRVVPDSLVDVLFTFVLSGYYDPALRDAIDQAPRRPLPTVSWFSGHQHFPDAFYEFNRSGRMNWEITTDLVALQGSVGELKNVAVVLVPSQRRLELGRIACAYPIELELDAAGNVTLLRQLPDFTLTTTQLTLHVSLSTPAGAVVTFDFGDGTGLFDSTALPHTYARPGRYDVSIRIADDERLTEYRASVVVSRLHSVEPPCVALPLLQTNVAGGEITLQPSLQVPSGELLIARWQMDHQEADAGSDPVTFTVAPGRYVLRLLAVRPLTCRFHSSQRHVPTEQLDLNGLRIVTNRTFDDSGTETTATPNAFTSHVFDSGLLSPIDRWSLELPLDDNPCLVSVSQADARIHQMDELSDGFLALEYAVRNA
jgi:hypothetical protein